jgi:DNA polymerase-4
MTSEIPVSPPMAGWARGEQRAIIHIDLDAFFVAVEQLDDPTLVGKPVIVGGRPDARGVVSSASYEARKLGVRSAMPTAQALRLCPDAVVLPGHRERYVEMSRRVMALLREYTPILEQISIDEAFLDVTGTEAQYGPPARLAETIQARIQSELGLSASLGVASNKLVAKIASDFRKPHGITVAPPGQEASFLAPLPVRKLWGVGEVTSRELARIGVETIGDLARLAPEALREAFGSHGERLAESARGRDDSPVVTEHEIKSLSREETFARDTRDATLLQRELLRLSEEVASRLRRRHLLARTVTLKLRYADFKTLTRQETLTAPTDSGPEICAQAQALLDAAWDRRQAVRLVGVGASGLTNSAGQLRLFESEEKQGAADREKRARLDAALDRIRERYGDDVIQRASLMEEADELWAPRTGEDIIGD